MNRLALSLLVAVLVISPFASAAELQIYPMPPDRFGGNRSWDPRSSPARVHGAPRYRGIYGALRNKWFEYDIDVPETGEYHVAVAIEGSYPQESSLNRFTFSVDGDAPIPAFDRTPVYPIVIPGGKAHRWITEGGKTVGEEYVWTPIADGKTIHLTRGAHVLRMVPEINSWGGFYKILLTTERIPVKDVDRIPLYETTKMSLRSMFISGDGAAVTYKINVMNPASFPQQVLVTIDGRSEAPVTVAASGTVVRTVTFPCGEEWSSRRISAVVVQPARMDADSWAKALAKLDAEVQAEAGRLITAYQQAYAGVIETRGGNLLVVEESMKKKWRSAGAALEEFAKAHNLPTWRQRQELGKSELIPSVPPAGWVGLAFDAPRPPAQRR